MKVVEQSYQELFNYLANELNAIALQTQMQEIEAIVMIKYEQQIKDAYNQGFRDGKVDWGIAFPNDVAEFPKTQNYYNKTFKSTK